MPHLWGTELNVKHDNNTDNLSGARWHKILDLERHQMSSSARHRTQAENDDEEFIKFLAEHFECLESNHSCV